MLTAMMIYYQRSASISFISSHQIEFESHRIALHCIAVNVLIPHASFRLYQFISRRSVSYVPSLCPVCVLSVFYWNHVRVNSVKYDYPTASCRDGGKGFLALSVLAFVAICAFCPIVYGRLMGKFAAVSEQHARKMVNIEVCAGMDNININMQATRCKRHLDRLQHIMSQANMSYMWHM